MSHKIFGKLLANLSSKEGLYQCNSANLVKHTDKWRYNRPCDPDKVDEIVHWIQKAKRVDGIIYIASIYHKKTVRYVCYDGNHRRCALSKVSNYPVLVSLLKKTSDGEIMDRFISLNQANPIPEIYTMKDPEMNKEVILEDNEPLIENNEIPKEEPEIISEIALESDLQRKKDVIDQVYGKFKKIHKDYFRGSNHPHLPHTNKRMFTNQLTSIMKNHPNMKAGTLYKSLDTLNIRYMKNIDTIFAYPSKKMKEGLEKCKTKKTLCYLFMKDFTEDFKKVTFNTSDRTVKMHKIANGKTYTKNKSSRKIKV
jgi:hypothetical protein